MTTARERADRVIARKDKEIKELRERSKYFADQWDNAEVELGEVKAAIDRVKALHAPHRFIFSGLIPMTDCDHCERDYPCPTIQTIEGDVK